MSQYTATVAWERCGASFADHRYSRAHRWLFDGGTVVPASSSPHVVRVPFSDPKGVDPEEAFVVSISSCHMLWFLDIAAQRGFVVEEYVDEAIGIMEKNEQGKMAMTLVTLRPRVVFSGARKPSEAQLLELHEATHEECYIAQSVKTEIRCQPVWA